MLSSRSLSSWVYSSSLRVSLERKRRWCARRCQSQPCAYSMILGVEQVSRMVKASKRQKMLARPSEDGESSWNVEGLCKADGKRSVGGWNPCMRLVDGLWSDDVPRRERWRED